MTTSIPLHIYVSSICLFDSVRFLGKRADNESRQDTKYLIVRSLKARKQRGFSLSVAYLQSAFRVSHLRPLGQLSIKKISNCLIVENPINKGIQPIKITFALDSKVTYLRQSHFIIAALPKKIKKKFHDAFSAQIL